MTNKEDIKSEEILFWRLIITLWSEKMVYLGIVTLISISFVIYAISLPNVYQSTALLTSADNSNSNALSRLASQFGGLASLAGINIGNIQDKKALPALEVLKTWGFIESFILENKIEAEVYAVRGWNQLDNELIYDLSIYDPVTKAWVRNVKPPKDKNNKIYS